MAKERVKKERKGTLKLSEIILYGVFGMFVNTFYLMFLTYNRIYYLTNILQLSDTLSAVVATASAWINVLTMILAGPLIDKIKFKNGKYRSWTLLGGILMVIALPMLYTNWHVSGTTAAVVYVVMFAIQSISYNSLWVAERALLGPMSKTSEDASSLALASQLASVFGLIGYSVVDMILQKITSNTTVMGLVYGALICLGTFGMFTMTKKYDINLESAPVAPVKGEKAPSFLKVASGPMIPFCISMIAANCHNGFFTAIVKFFCEYRLNDVSVASMVATITGVTGLIGSIAAKILIGKLGKKVSMYLFTALTALCYIGIYFVHGKPLFLALVAGVGIFSVVGSFLLVVMSNDIADYAEMTSGVDGRAMIQAFSGSTIRIGAALATTIASFSLAALGNGEQSVSILTSFGPAVFCVLSVLAMLFYKLDENRIEEFRKEKAERIAEAAAKQQ
ncbi:MAG: MFS transporter [Oscillospiraceae bacterium]|nr:MFS transporter [Oscillospiraceae bacterium]